LAQALTWHAQVLQTGKNLSIWLQTRRWFKSTSKRTFVVYPIAVIAFELGLHRGRIAFHEGGAILLLWGYLQYRLAGMYRIRRGGGGPGLEVPPERLVIDGPYRYTRNPMYLGHLIFMIGLAVTFSSWLAVALSIFHIVWFHQRVLGDENRLEARFGKPYLSYKAQVSRWIPGLA
jgi:protein-S-isoprenylcysteine O-methyltransferase Ste14